MANEFIIKNGFVSKGNSIVEGNLSGQTFNLINTPVNNNAATEILVRNSTTGVVEYRNSSTLSGGGGGQTITGYTYDDSTNTFSIGISGSTSFDATINKMSGITITNNLIVSGNTGMGIDTPTETLHIDGTFRLEDGNQNDGYVLTSDSTGVGSWLPVTAATPTVIYATDLTEVIDAFDSFNAAGSKAGIVKLGDTINLSGDLNLNFGGGIEIHGGMNAFNCGGSNVINISGDSFTFKQCKFKGNVDFSSGAGSTNSQNVININMTGNRGSFLECEFVDVVGGENGDHSSSSYFPIVIDNMNTWSSMVLSNIWINTRETAGGSDAKPYGSLGIMWNKSAGTNGMSFITNNWALSGLENADESTKWISAQNAMKILVSGSSSNVPGTGGGGGFATIFYDQSLTVDSNTTSTGGYNSTGWDRFPTMWGVNINLEDLNPTTSPLFGTQGDIQISGNTAWIKVGDIGKDTDWVEITNSGGTDTFSWSDPVVTAGNTSGDCIDQLWVHTISGCSPVTIGSSIQDITSTATGTHSIAYGSGTTSSGNYSHAEGYGTEAEGNSSHSQGTRTFAGGESSHAGGHQSNSGKTLFINNIGGFGHYTVTEPLDKGIDSTCDYSAILGGIDHFISDGQTTSIILGGNSNSISGSSGSANQTIIGGNSNRIYPINAFFGSSNNIIAGGDGNFINSSSATGRNSIMGGGNHVITDNVSNSSIIGGEDNVFNSALVRSVILGGVGITGSSNDTVYVPNLNIGSVGSGTPLISLGLDSNGNVVTGTTGGGSSSTITGYTYNETNNTFSIGISGSTPFDATISEMSGLTLNGDLTVTGNTQLDGDLIVEGLTTLKGQTTIGNSFGDSVDIVARVTANIVPSVTNSVDLGTSTLFWENLYTHHITGGTLNLYSGLTTNNSGTEILVRNSTTGNIEKRDVSTLTGGTGGGQTITGYTYNESNNTFSIGISGSTPLDSTINVVSGLTVTNNLIVSGNTGMGTDTPQEKLDVRGDVLIENGGIVYSDLSNAIMSKFVLSAASSTLGNIGVTNPQGAGLSIGYRGETEPTYDGYGKQGDGYIYSSAAANGLNIISQQGTNKDDYVRFYVGQSTGASSGNTPDIHIQGSGATRGNVGINTESPTEKLHIAGSLRIVDGTEQNGYVLTSDATGVSSWQSPLVTDELNELIDANTNSTSVVLANHGAGVQATAGSGDGNFIALSGALSGTSGNDNIVIGRNAGAGKIGAADNIILGKDAMGAVTASPTKNIMIGYRTGYNLYSNTENVMIGYQAGDTTTSNDYSTIMGAYAGLYQYGDHQTIIGYRAGQDDTGYAGVTDCCTILGSHAAHNVVGERNIAIGFEAGYNSSVVTQYNGSHNILLGNGVLLNASGTTRQLVVGGLDRYLLSGVFNTTDRAKLGVNISNDIPTANLQVKGHASDTTTVLIQDGSDNTLVSVDNVGNLHVTGRTTTENFTMLSGATLDYVLTSDASGNASWQPASGGTGTSYWVLTGTSNEVLVDAQGLNGYSISGSSPGSIIAGGTGHTLSDSQNSAIVGGLSNTVLNSSSYLGGDSHFGGTLNIISGNTLLHYGNINVGGGSNVTIGSVRSVMLSTTDSKMLDSTNGFIIGGDNHKGGATGYGLYQNSNSGIIGGANNTFASGVDRSVIIGGNGLSATTNDTVYVPNLNIGSVGSITPDSVNLGLDSNGNVVTGTTGGGTPFSWSDPVVTSGNTSGNCISDLWVSNIHSCSPLYINPADEGNVYYGSNSGITIDIINKSIGINTNTPLGGLDIRQDNLYVSNEVGKLTLSSTTLDGNSQYINNIDFISAGGIEKDAQIKSVSTGIVGKLVFGTTPGTGVLTDWMTLSDRGRLGLGTLSPDSSLHISGSGISQINVVSSDNNAILKLKSSDSANAYVDFEETSGNRWLMGSYNVSDKFVWATGNTFSAGSLMGLTTDGDLGVGNISPSSRLHVNKSSLPFLPTLGNDNVALFESDNETELAIVGSFERNVSIKMGDKEALKGEIVYENATDEMTFKVDSSTILTLDSDTIINHKPVELREFGTGSAVYNLQVSQVGVGEYEIITGKTGADSGSCISELWVSNWESCSPLHINTYNQGNIYMGTQGGLPLVTVDITTPDEPGILFGEESFIKYKETQKELIIGEDETGGKVKIRVEGDEVLEVDPTTTKVLQGDLETEEGNIVIKSGNSKSLIIEEIPDVGGANLGTDVDGKIIDIPSDSRVKDNIIEIPNLIDPLQFIQNVKGYQFEFKPQTRISKTGKKHYGFKVDDFRDDLITGKSDLTPDELEINNIARTFVKKCNTKFGLGQGQPIEVDGMNYIDLIPFMIESIKQLDLNVRNVGAGISNKFVTTQTLTSGQNTINHNLNDENVIVQVIEVTTGQLIIPNKVSNYLLDSVIIDVEQGGEFKIIIIA